MHITVFWYSYKQNGNKYIIIKRKVKHTKRWSIHVIYIFVCLCKRKVSLFLFDFHFLIQLLHANIGTYIYTYTCICTLHNVWSRFFLGINICLLVRSLTFLLFAFASVQYFGLLVRALAPILLLVVFIPALLASQSDVIICVIVCALATNSLACAFNPPHPAYFTAVAHKVAAANVWVAYFRSLGPFRCLYTLRTECVCVFSVSKLYVLLFRLQWVREGRLQSLSNFCLFFTSVILLQFKYVWVR